MASLASWKELISFVRTIATTLIPECFDAEGTRTIVPVSSDVARLRAKGKLSPQEVKKEIVRRFQDGVYQSPARPGISYMLSRHLEGSLLVSLRFLHRQRVQKRAWSMTLKSSSGWRLNSAGARQNPNGATQ